MERKYSIEGMSCQHCVNALMEGIGAVSGVQSVDVRLADQSATVIGRDFRDEDIAGAVVDAGYTIRGPSR